MLPVYATSQYRPSLLAYCVLQTIAQLCHDDHCVINGEETASSAAATADLEAADIEHCTTAVRNFLYSTGATLVYPVYY